MAAAAGEAIGLPAAATPTVWLGQLGLAIGTDRMFWWLAPGVQPSGHRIAHAGMMNDPVQLC